MALISWPYPKDCRSQLQESPTKDNSSHIQKILRLYKLSETTPSYPTYIKKFLPFCPESHTDFSHSNPLWKNTQFFIKLPFKLNEDVNPTKATHPGMSPTYLKLAQQECSDLLQQGLIEPTKSD